MKLNLESGRVFACFAVIAFVLLTTVTYFPVLSGKVPLPNHIVRQFPTWPAPEVTNDLHTAELGDLVILAYPFRGFGARSVQDLSLPLWNPYLLGGAPFVANAQSALFYPLNLPAYILPLPIAWSLALMIRPLVAGLFMTYFARSIGASKGGAVLAGILFGWSGFMTAWQGFAIGDAAIWLPLMCYAVQRLSDGPGAFKIGFAAVVFAMPALAGHPETAIHVTLATVLFAVILSIKPGFKTPLYDGRFLVRFIVAGCVSLGLASIQLLPTIEWVGQIAFRLDVPWPTLAPEQALGLVSRDLQSHPNSAGIHIPEAASYIGMITPLAAALAYFHRNKRAVLAVTVMTVLALIAAFSVPPSHWVLTHVPVLKAIKNGRLLLIVNFGLAALAGLGVSALQQRVVLSRRRVGYVVITIAFILTLALVYALGRNSEVQPDLLRSPFFSLILLVCCFLLITAAVSGHLVGRPLTLIVCSIAAFDLLSCAYGYTTFASSQSIFPRAPVFDFLQGQGDSASQRIAGVSGAYPVNAPLMYSLAAVDGYDIPLRRFLMFTEGLRESEYFTIVFSEASLLAANDRRMDMLNVRYLVTNKASPDFELMRRQDRFPLVFEDGNIAVFENRRVLPRAFAVPVTGIEIIEDTFAQLERLTDASFDPEKSVILSTAPPPTANHAPTAPFSSQVEVNSNDPKLMSLRVETSEPAVLVISQIFYPGWRATVDGVEVPVAEADLALTGVVVPEGTHDVRVFFHPFSFHLGSKLTIVALVSITGLVLTRLFRNCPGRWFGAVGFAGGIATVVACLVIVEDNRSGRTAEAVSSSVAVSGNQQAVVTIKSEELQSGYARFDSNSAIAEAFALLRYSQGPFVSETAIPATVPLATGVLAFQLDDHYRTAIAAVNSAERVATINFSVDSSEEASFTIPPAHKIAAFLNERPFQLKTSRGILRWRSDVPIVMSAVQTFKDSSNPFLMGALPIANTTLLQHQPLYIPLLESKKPLAELLLVNPTETPLTGDQVWYSATGVRLLQSAYMIRPLDAIRLPIPTLEAAWVQIMPSQPQIAPEATMLSLLDDEQGPSLVTIKGTPAVSHAQVYLPVSSDRTAQIALINPHPTTARVSVGTDVRIQPFGLLIFGLPASGILRLESSPPVAITLFRSGIVNGKERIFMSYPATSSSAASVFPHVAAAGPFTTEIHLFASDTNHVNGILRFMAGDGQPFKIDLNDR